jgi:hypothetical protein
MATGTIQIEWSANPGYAVKTQPTSMNQGDILNVIPPAQGCTLNFNPSLALSGTTTPVYASYQFTSTAKAFAMPTEAGSYNFTFSINGYGSQPRVDGRSVPVHKT